MSKSSGIAFEIADRTGEGTLEERWALIERVVASRHIRRSARLRDFLEYVGTRTIKEAVERVQEQEIGVVVFGREPNYDTSLDNIVRVNATELRKRLELYFAEEGLSEELVLDISRGGYTPSFRRRSVEVPQSTLSASVDPAAAPELPPEPTAIVPVRTARQVGLKNMLLGSTLCLLVILAGGLFWQNHELRGRLTPWKTRDALQEFWSHFLASETETDLVLGDSSLALAEDMTGQDLTLNQYLDKSTPQWKSLDPTLKTQLTLVLDRDDGSLGDFRVARSILALDPQSSILHLKSAREMTPEYIRRNSVVLIGNSQSNPWIDLYEDKLNFTVEYDTAAHHAFVKNRAPLAGEKAIYDFPPDPARVNGYCTISFLPALNGTGSALLLSGTDWRATRAAGEFVANNDEMRAFRRLLPNDRFQHFELLLESSHLIGTPMHSTIVAYRSLP